MLYIRDDTSEVAILERGKSRSGMRFSEKSKSVSLLASDSRDSAMRLQRGAQKISGPAHRVALVPFDLRAYVSELVKRIRLSVESHPRPLRFHLSRERVRFVESSNGLSWFTHRDGALSSKPVKALGDDLLYES